MAEQNQETIDIMQQVNYEMQRYGKLTGATADALRDAEVGVKGFSEALRSAPKSVVDAATSMGTAMYKGEKGAAAFNKSIDSMAAAADSAITVLMAMIPGGILVKAVVGGLGLLAKALIKTAAEVDKAANEQGDALYNTYQKLGKAGVVAAGGTTQLGQDLYKLGLSFTEADSMVSLFSENSQDLALFGKTAFQGADAFKGIVNAAKPYREELQRLGLSQVEQNEAVMGYIKLQTRLGNAGKIQAQGYEATAAAAAKYIEEQDALTKLTGVSRKEQEKTLNDAMRNARFAATLDGLRAEGKEKEAKALENSLALASRLGPETQKGLQDIASGFVNTKEARAVMMSSQGEVVKLVQDAKNGLLNNEKDLTKAYDKVEGQIANTASSMRGLTQATGDTGTFIKYEEARKAELLRKQGATTEESLAAAKKQTAGQIAGDDKRLKNQSETIVAQQDATLATQQLVDKAITPATEATLAMAKAAKAAAVALNKLAGTEEQEKASATATGQGGGGGALGAEIMAQSESLNEEQTKILQKAQEAYRESVKNGTLMQKYYGVALDEKMQAAKNTLKLAEKGKLNADLKPIADGGGAKGGAPAAGGAAGGGGAGAAPQAKSASVAGGGPPAINPKDFVKFTGGTGDESHFNQLQPGVQTAFLEMAQQYNNLTGDKLQMNSGFRSPEEQAKTDSGTNPKAAPGMSLHQQGRAVDINSSQRNKLEQLGLLAQSGFKPLANDPPHIYMKDGGILSGPESGYKPNLVAHGSEAVIPLKTGSVPVSFNDGSITRDIQSAMTDAIASMAGPLLEAMSEMIREQKNTNSINQKLLQAARN